MYVCMCVYKSVLFTQALEFFFFAACIGAIAILFAVMSFFYKYVDLSTYNKLQTEGSDPSLDETRALILSHEKEQQHQQQRNQNGSVDEKGDESEF